MCTPKLRIRDFYSHFPQVLVQACFAGHKHKMHREIHRKALSDAELRKRMTKAPTNSTQIEKSTTGTWSRTSPEPAMQRRWPEAVVKGRPTLGGRQRPLGASLPLLALAVACLHAKAVELLFHAKNSHQHCVRSCINRGVPLLYNTPHKEKSFITFEQHSKGLGPR